MAAVTLVSAASAPAVARVRQEDGAGFVLGVGCRDAADNGFVGKVLKELLLVKASRQVVAAVVATLWRLDRGRDRDEVIEDRLQDIGKALACHSELEKRVGVHHHHNLGSQLAHAEQAGQVCKKREDSHAESSAPR